MNDFDFDKSFADDLQKGFEFEFVEADWEKMAARLEAAERRRRRRGVAFFAFPVAASAGLLLMGWGLWRMSDRVETLQNELSRLQSALPAVVAGADTTIHHVSVIQYDTIYRTIVLQESRWATESSRFSGPGRYDSLKFGKQDSVSGSRQQFAPPVADFIKPVDPVNHIGSESVQPDTLSWGSQNLVANEPPDRVFNPLNLLPARQDRLQADRRPNPLQKVDLPPFHKPAKDLVAGMIYRLRPHNVGLGLSVGSAWPQVNKTQSSAGFTGGVAGQVAFGQRIRLKAEFRWSRVWFKIKNGDQDVPFLSPPTPDDVLDFVQVRQPSIDYLLGLQYQLRPERRLQPYFALAWAGSNTLEQTLQYEFHNAITKSETNVEMPYTEQNAFRARWQLGLGAEWHFGKRLALGGEAFWQNPIGNGGFLEGSRVGLKANIYYFL